jgi:hypothetical protein
LHVLLEVALDGRDGLLAVFLAEFDHRLAPVLASKAIIAA